MKILRYITSLILLIALPLYSQTQQTFNPKQIRPSSNNTWVLTTTGNPGNAQSVWAPIPASSALGITPVVVPPIAGQYVVIYPTVGTITFDELAGRSSINSTSGNFVWICSGIFCSIADNTTANWSGFALPSFVNPANVTAIYADAITSGQPQTQMPTGGSNLTSLTCGGGPQLLPQGSPNNPWAATEVTQLLSIPATSIASLSCPIILGTSTSSSRTGETINVSAVRLIVYYTGPPPPPDPRVQINPPLMFNSSLNQLSFDPLGTGYLSSQSIVNLPAANASTGKIFQIADGTSSTDCTTGGGSTPVLCRSNGTVWSSFSPGGGGGSGTIVASAEVVSFSATPTFSTAFNVSRIVLTGNITSFTLGAGSDGQDKTLCFKQGSGPFTVTAPAGVHGFFTIGTVNADWNCQTLAYDSTDSIWLATGPGVVNQ